MAPQTKPASSQQIQLIWIGFLASAACIVALAELTGPPPGNQLSTLHWALIGIALLFTLIGSVLRRKALSKARIYTDKVRAQKAWAAGQIVSFAFAESILLYGFVSRFAPPVAPRWFPISFYALAALLLLIWRPTDAPDERPI